MRMGEIERNVKGSKCAMRAPLTPETYLFLGINKVDASLKDQLVFIEGTAPPSSIVSAIESTGRDAILRGSGSSNSTSPM